MVSRVFVCSGLLLFMIVEVGGQCDGSGPENRWPLPVPQMVKTDNNTSLYGPILDCYWLLQAPATARVIINIMDIHGDGNNDCNADYVNVYDGASADDILLGTVCEPNINSIDLFVSSGNTLFLWLHSDNSSHGDGFKGLFFSNDSAIQPNCSDDILTASLSIQYIMSANLPEYYTPDYNCTTYFQTESTRYVLRFTRTLIDFEETDGCTDDRVELWEGTDVDNMVLLGTECHTAAAHFSTRVTTTRQLAAVTMVTGSVAHNHYGLFIGYQQVQSGANVTSPIEGQTAILTIPEDQPIGTIDSDEAQIQVTSEGSVSYTLLQDGISSDMDFQVTQGQDNTTCTFNLELLNTLDYETKVSYLLTFIAWDDVNPAYSSTAYINVTLTDVDDIAPVITNLPGNTTIRRLEAAGTSIYNVTSTDADITMEHQVPAYMIFGGNRDGVLQIDEASGEIKLAKSASTVSLTVTSYVITIAAFSVSVSSGLASFGAFSLYFYPDGAPVCSHVIAWGDTIAPTDATGQITFTDPWSCSDESTITYTLGAVNPTLRTSLFSIDSRTGEISQTRSFAFAEVPNNQFNMTVTATDTLDQSLGSGGNAELLGVSSGSKLFVYGNMVVIDRIQTQFTVVINVTTLTCYPNPRKLYVRMGTASGTYLDNDFNCSRTGLTYSIKEQHPANTFDIAGSYLVLRNEVYKIRYYTLILEVSDGVDSVDLSFQVTIRMRQCTNMLSRAVPTLVSNVVLIIAVLVAFFVT